MDRDIVNRRLIEVFGQPHSSPQYVNRWNLHASFDLVAERRPGPDGLAWMPWPGGRSNPLPFGTHRTPDDRTNSNVYVRAPSLASGHLLEARITTVAELDQLIGYIRGRLAALR